jgi:hypothetical protein
MTPRLEQRAAEMRARAEQRKAEQFAAARAKRWPAIRTKYDPPRFTPVMAEVLKRMAAGHDLFVGGAGFWVDTYSSEQRATVAALCRRSWIEPALGTERRFVLTAKGRAAAAYGALGRAGRG